MAQMHERETDAQSKYLEKQFDEANSQLKDIVRSKDCHLDADPRADGQFHSQRRQQESA